jgi:hypothetical protein
MVTIVAIAVVLMLMDLHRNGYLVVQVSFGRWLVPAVSPSVLVPAR